MVNRRGPGRPSKSRTLNLWMNAHLVGQWRFDGGKQSFRYVDTWLAYDRRRPISLSIPLAHGTDWASDEAVAAYFGNLLPDNGEMLRRLATKFGARSTGAFDLLEQIGRDCVGAIQFLPDGMNAPAVHRIDGDRSRTPGSRNCSAVWCRDDIFILTATTIRVSRLLVRRKKRPYSTSTDNGSSLAAQRPQPISSSSRLARLPGGASTSHPRSRMNGSASSLLKPAASMCPRRKSLPLVLTKPWLSSASTA